MQRILLPAVAAALLASAPAPQTSTFEHALSSAERALDAGDRGRALNWIRRALERDPKSREAWDLRARWAEAAGDTDELVYSRYRELQLAIAQEAPRREIDALEERLLELDPLAGDLASMNELFIRKLQPIAERYEDEERPHSAISVYKQILALDPDDLEAQEAIERIASLPDPSLAEDAKPRDLFEDVSDEWIRKRDAKHEDWGDRDEFKSEHYVTRTNAGYEVMLRAATAMDQMNLFYREFFDYDGSVPRINLHIFKSRDDYLRHGEGPPVKWSAGHFTGSSVELYVGESGFQGSVGTLFHEAAHQFVSLATRAVGWLNEGLASFFEGCQLLPNGSVEMNLPANHRLLPLVRRMENGWMADHEDGIDDRNPSGSQPRKAPTFRIVLENKYAWGPPWYAPTWGVVYFLYNYQDPADGRYVYRASFREFFNKSSGRMGDSAVSNFEEVVLANPAPPTERVESTIELPESVDELDEVWKAWLLKLAAEQTGKLEVDRPWFDWARYAVQRGEYRTAKEHFEKGLREAPGDPDLLLDFADLLAEHFDDEDRAAKLVLQALRVLESADAPDAEEIARAERKLRKWDPTREDLEEVQHDIWDVATEIADQYLERDLHLMAMDLSWRFSRELNVPGILSVYEQAARESRKSLFIWSLAYNEQDLSGWASGGAGVFQPNGETLDAKYGRYQPGNYDYRINTLDETTSGDYSLEAQVLVKRGEVGFGGLVFGRKDDTTFNAVILLPGKEATETTAGSAFVDVSSFFGGQPPRIVRHVPVDVDGPEGESRAGSWNELRLDVTGRNVDVWFDDELLVQHEFSTRDVLRGSIGLITGTGEMRFRNVRYLAREPRDPGAEIERRVRLEPFADSEESVGGSWLGKRPPFPTVARWVQGEREDWDEAGPVPQLLVFWSIRQNDLIPIHDWLAYLGQRYSKVDLRVTCIASYQDDAEIDDYLKTHRFPGEVGVDTHDAPGIGDSFERYAIGRFNLPRLILIDIDGRVIWEGDPGFSKGYRWTPGVESYLDAPLEDLIANRNLHELSSWRRRWREEAVPAMREANLAAALEVLHAAEEFDGRGDPDVSEAQRRLTVLRAKTGALAEVADVFEEQGSEPAMGRLLEWAELMDVEIEGRTLKRELRPLLRGDCADDWEKAVAEAGRFERRAERDGAEDAYAQLVDRLESLEGLFPRLLLERVRERDPASVASVLAEAERMPDRWLAREYFGW